MILHITRRAQWEEALRQRVYRGDTLDTEGFIHCAEHAQLLRVAERFWAGQPDLVLLVIDPARLHSELRYEPAGDAQHYPHIYGPLNPDAVTQVLGLPPDADERAAIARQLAAGG